MQSYKITDTNNIDAFANRKSSAAKKLIIIIFLIILCGLIIKEKSTRNLTFVISTVLFIGVLFYSLFFSLKKLMWFIGKSISYTLREKDLLIQHNLDNCTEMGFLPRYLYKTGRRKGGYRDVHVKFDDLKRISKNNKGDLILRSSDILTLKITIPRELSDLRDLENQLQSKIKRK